jgi:hypothetical protein
VSPIRLWSTAFLDEREITCSCTKQGTDATDFGSVTAVSVDITAEAQYKTVPVGATVV